MKLHSPFCITSRLLPGVRVPGDGKLTEISIEDAGVTSSGRTRFRYYIDSPEFEFQGEDLKSGVGGSTLEEGMTSLLSFLSAAAESYAYRMRTHRQGENEDLFPPHVVAWAYQHQDELSILQLEIEESQTPLITEEAE